MKRIFHCVLVSALLICAPCFSKSQSVILGIEAAKHYHAKSIKKTYILADRFLRKSNANYYKEFVQSKTHYPVKVVRHQGFYYVTIGPIYSAAETRKTAGKFMLAPKLAKSRPNQPKHTKQKLIVAKANLVINTTPVKTTPLKQTVLPKPIVRPLQRPIHSSRLADRVQENWLVSVGAGVQYPSFKSTMSINNGTGAAPPYNQDIYTTKSRPQPIVALAGGYRRAWSRQWVPAVSVIGSYQHLFSRNVGGVVIQYSDPTFTNYGYDWEVSSDVVLALLKLNLVEVASFSPYFVGGMGGAINQISNYNEGALTGASPRTNPGFRSTSQLKFAYRVGAGIDYQLDPQVIVSAEYQYQSIGTISSRHGTSTWSSELLNLGNYRANAVLLNVTYLIDK